LESPVRPADIVAVRAYRQKYGFGFNFEQEIISEVGIFARLGWSDGNNEAWAFSDVDRTATAGISIKGELWHRAHDKVGLANAVSGISKVHQEFLAAGGTGILAGDGGLRYALEDAVEIYYDFDIWKSVHAALDYQFVMNPAFNRDRGPVSVFGARMHWEF
jgi:high affinity Mn2+ porin